jgi:hypothetical protein
MAGFTAAPPMDGAQLELAKLGSPAWRSDVALPLPAGQDLLASAD